MKRFLGGMIALLVCQSLVLAQTQGQGQGSGSGQGQEQGSGQGQGQTISDPQFVMLASAGGMAEVNMGNLAVKQASSADVKKFAQQMITDHTKANRELLALANRKRLKAASAMDAEHRQMRDRLAKMSGAEFDREYMAGQVKDHVDTVALFEKQARDGQDADLKKWATDTLPHLREHLRMAREIHGRLTGEKGQGGSGQNKGPDHK
jgi:putative membrane protein